MKRKNLFSRLCILFIFQSCLKATTQSSFVSDQKTWNQGNTGFEPPSSLPEQQPEDDGIDRSSLQSCNDYNQALELNDPYLCNQWHILANQQSVKKLPQSTTYEKKPSKDINIGLTYQKYTGQGVKFHVTDSGLEHTHSDIQDNFLLQGSRHFGISVTEDRNPTPSGRNKFHGTSVSGLIAATANNNIGLVGISYDSKISVDNLIGAGNQSAAAYEQAILKDASYDIWNGSFGIPVVIYQDSTRIIRYVHETSKTSTREIYITGANESNITYFKSNGNDGTLIGSHGNLEYAASLHVVNAIAAIGSKNVVSRYSTPGSNLVLSGYADNGGNSLGTCTLTLSNSYTCSFNGTSSAAPVVAGAAGLVKQALNESLPDHKWTDLIWTLIKTANRDIQDRGDDDHYSSVHTIDGQEQVIKLTNAANLEHSFDHGFGVVDVTKAISEAENRIESIGLPTSIESESNEQKIIQGGKCEVQEIEIDQDFQIWSVELSIQQSGIALSDLAIFLIMPDEKTVMVKTTRLPTALNNGSNQATHAQKYNVRAPMATNAKGKWKVKVCTRNAQGTLSSSRLKIYGFEDLETLK